VTDALHAGEKTLLLELKADRQRSGQDSAVNQTWVILHVWCKLMEGLFYLIAVAIPKACLGVLFLFNCK
jgi:hypothetical protein